MTKLYDRLDTLREEAGAQFSEALAPAAVRTPQGQSERSVYARMHAERVSRLSAVEHDLVIGRLDLDDGDPLYIGRIGLYDSDYEPMLVDWRAPAATSFYRATPAERLGVRRRRHIHLNGRRVVRLDDDVFLLDDLDEAPEEHLVGEAALLASLGSARTGRMADIVATIQAEQDRVIRSDLAGILVVEGGPGTGKTVVALHRAAYLLYTHRNQLADRGVLVVGPNPTFLRYIDQVLPGLGETDVVLSSVGELYPGTSTTKADPPETAVVKGDARMAEVLRRAVASYERVPSGGMEIATDRDTYQLPEDSCRRIRDAARERAQQSNEPHNRVRRFVVRDVLDELTEIELAKLESVLDGVEVPEENEDEVDQELTDLLDRETLRLELRSSSAVHDALDTLWPELTPQRVLADLFSDAGHVASVAPELTAAERAALLRTDPIAWTVGDVPLLDEVAELVGELDVEVYQAADEQVRAELERRKETAEQRRLMRDAHDVAMDMAIEEEVTIPVDPELVLERYHDTDAGATVAERASTDRHWQYGHVIVDEAQELSAMVWRVLRRRCPTLSMTVVGDPAQTGSADGVSAWGDVLEPLATGRWRRRTLTINYRTTEPIMAVAADVLAASGIDAVAPRSVRPDGAQPWSCRVTDGELDAVLAEIAHQERSALGEGTLAFVVPRDRVADCVRALGTREQVATAADDDVLAAPVAVLTPAQVKGLEFDGTVVVAPEEILAGSPRGYSDLYVALTRPTRRLGVVHSDPLPAMLSRLQPLENRAE